MTLTPAAAPSTRLSPGRVSAPELADQLARGAVTVVDVREPVELLGGHIAGSRNVPLARLAREPLPEGPLVLVCHSGHRSTAAREQLLSRNPSRAVSDLEGGIEAWQQAGLPLLARARAPLPLMRQVQIAAGSLVLLGVILSQSVAPAWMALSAFVGAGLVFAGLSGFCGMARLLALMPWNRVSP
ncbi:rhodanese-like domain-containing protein [Cyanobium sp. LEGE 06143]|uniref:rhodanese-like domain-containing protein n=1 Tax=Cyanobium sp. LEGE 06143 TaxID=945727 RepID=UPI00187F7454|nr:rhodanese-like domain-containing protein [Cyanobium sp. LEGE 06143]MBE9174066.1 rhodanese-like domain-containing protein [Cyanobium sp. LEGE 06143]